MSAAADCGLIVFLRFPEKGKVKTRIASSLGEEAALAIYEEMTSISLDMVLGLTMQVYLFYEGGLPEVSDRKNVFQYFSQSPGNLGEKMHHAFDLILQKHKKAIIIGSDCPYLSAADVNEGFSKLETYDVVIGPSADGGYYLLGCKKLHPSLFEGIHWSTPEVLEQTIQRISELGCDYSLLRRLYDVDTEEEWLRYQQTVEP